MTGKGGITNQPNRRLRLMTAAFSGWLAILCLLGAWWGRLLVRQAGRIEELEAQVGISQSAAHSDFTRVSRMMFWESGTFFVLLLAASAVLVWLYWSEARRARSVQAFFASLTHELRTPLTSIRLQAESLAEHLPTSDQERRLLVRLLEDTSRLESQVERTLELARVEGGGAVLSQQLLLKPWLDYFLRNWEESHAAALALDVKIADLAIQADPGAVQVIMKNLFENTLRHGGGRSPREASLYSEEHEGWVVLRYRDNGKGYLGDIRKLGSLFHKGEDSPGAGVGLYLVSVLMKRMGGRAEFSANPQLETALWFRAGAGGAGG